MWYHISGVSVVLICTIQSKNAAYLRCFAGSIDNYMEVNLDNATALVNTIYFDVTKDTVMYTFGYLGKMDGNATKSILNAYFDYYDGRNVCVMNWQKEANSGIIGVSYPYVVEVTHDLAKKYATAILDLFEAGMSLDSLHLVGLSLGAHMCGEIARNILSTIGQILSRITGLDAAYPEFDGLLKTQQPLSKTDAKFVVIFHTDPKNMGMETATGTIDFYFNYGFYKNGTNRQPGCEGGVAVPFSDKALCSHNRSVGFYVATLADPKSMPASRAVSYDAWVAANGAPNNNTYVGDLANREYCGVYYLTTNDAMPFGKGDAGLHP